MKVGVFCTHYNWETHYETDLEIVQRHLKKGDEVTMFTCDKRSFSCCENIWSVALHHKKEYQELQESICNKCEIRQKKGISLLSGKVNILPIIREEEMLVNYDFDDLFLKSVESLQSLVVDEYYDVGWSMLSSLISFSRDPFVDVSRYSVELKKLYCDIVRVIKSAEFYIEHHQLDRVYVFNGRFSYTKGIFRAAKKSKIPVYIHERGSVAYKFTLFKGHLPHDIIEFKNRVDNHWDLCQNAARKDKIGRQFYSDKIKGFAGSWTSFTKNFESGKLPEQWEHEKENIVMYTSSEDEFVSIDKTWLNPYFKDQLTGLEYVCKKFIENNNLKQRLYIRMHPNSAKLPKTYLETIQSLAVENRIFIIEPNSTISSYDLLFNCSKVVTFGSTITMEAIYWGKPVVLLGKSLYYYLEGIIIPKDVNEINSLCFEKSLPIPDNEDAIKFGFYARTNGINYKYYQPLNFSKGFFKGVDLFNLTPIHNTFKEQLKKPIKYYLKKYTNKNYFLDTLEYESFPIER